MAGILIHIHQKLKSFQQTTLAVRRVDKTHEYLQIRFDDLSEDYEMPVAYTILNKNYFNDINSTIISLQVRMVCRSVGNVGRKSSNAPPTKSTRV